MSNQQLPLYYHLEMKQMEIIRQEPLQVTQAAQRIFDLDDLVTARPGGLTTITQQEMEQFLRDYIVVAQRALVFADNASIDPDPVERVAYYYFYHDFGVLLDPPSHAVAVWGQGRSTRAAIPVFPIHEEHFTSMLKRFPKLPANPYPTDTEEITDRHPGNLNADMRTEGDIPMVNLSVTTTEAFSTIRHWVYTQDQLYLVRAILGEQLATSVRPGVFTIYEPAYGSAGYFNECCEAAALSVASDPHEPSALTDAEDRVTEIIDLATRWVLINDKFWAVVLTLDRIIPVARDFSRSVASVPG